MLDKLHDYIIRSLAISLDDASAGEKERALAETLFRTALELCKEREDHLTSDDWVMIGEWLNETGSYFRDDDFVIDRMVLSKSPERSGRQILDLRDFVARARAARQAYSRRGRTAE